MQCLSLFVSCSCLSRRTCRYLQRFCPSWISARWFGSLFVSLFFYCNHGTCMNYDHRTCMYYDHSTCMRYDHSTSITSLRTHVLWHSGQGAWGGGANPPSDARAFAKGCQNKRAWIRVPPQGVCGLKGHACALIAHIRIISKVRACVRIMLNAYNIMIEPLSWQVFCAAMSSMNGASSSSLALVHVLSVDLMASLTIPWWIYCWCMLPKAFLVIP